MSGGGLGRALLAAMRRLGREIQRTEQAIADAVGINTTDLHCLEILRSRGPIPASELAEASGLSRAAITTVIDRMERAGFACRVDDPADRRRVVVELTPVSEEQGRQMFGDLMRSSLELHAGYTTEQLELLLDFVSRTTSLLVAHAERVGTRSSGQSQEIATRPDAGGSGGGA